MRIKLYLVILLSVIYTGNADAQKSTSKVTIKGTVMDAARSPIANAIIMIDGQKTSSVTDAKGKYTIKVKRNAEKIGIFTFGNGIKEESIGGRTLIDFTFGKMSSQLPQEEDVAKGEKGVDVGYGSVKNKNLTSDINSIDGTNKKYASYHSISDMIQREVSGVRVNGSTVVIQDSKDLFGSVNALIVVDGVYMDALPDIPPVNVKSVEVLKGSSAAIYGSRGYGGVILIKTKLGN